MDYISLVIRSSQKVPSAQKEKWADITDLDIFTRCIETPDLNAETDLTPVVSGVPSVFARANMFKLSINAMNSSSVVSAGLMTFYKNLVEEWRGLIACIALDYANIKVRRIWLKYSDVESYSDKNIAETTNIYEPKGAFGNDLFERKALWSLQGVLDKDSKSPFIDVIIYGKDALGNPNVIGAVSPESLFFTAPNYLIEGRDKIFVNENGKLFDPVGKVKIDENVAIQLLSYIKYLNKNLQVLRNYYKDLAKDNTQDIRPDFATISANLNNWIEEIKQTCGINDNEDNYNIPPVDKFLPPFNKVFNYSSNLYGKNGIIEEEDRGGVLFDPRNLLLPQDAKIARIELGNIKPDKLADLPVYVLKASKKGESGSYVYFALPLTPLGLNVFGSNIGKLIGIDPHQTLPSNLEAVYDENMSENNLEVTLNLETSSNKKFQIKQVYTTTKNERVSARDLLLWPNFISNDWDRYFFYSDLPHNGTTQSPFRATPIVGKYEDQRFDILLDEKTQEPILLANNGTCIGNTKESDNGLVAKMHVVSDVRSGNQYGYEIYESNMPFKGVRLSTANKESGYLIIHYDLPTSSSSLPKDMLADNNQMRDEDGVILGIDFGSTNTSIAYSSGTHNPEPIILHNHRISLLNVWNETSRTEADLFFFQGKEIGGNSIKSILTLHDQRRLNGSDNDKDKKEVSGGFPCFDTSMIPVENVTNNRIIFRGEEVDKIELVYNMKWSDSEYDKANKEAFLRSLLLHVYAELYQGNNNKRYYPKILKWSYPSAMNSSLIDSYGEIWDRVCMRISPIRGKELQPCKHDVKKTDYTKPVFEGSGSQSTPFGVQQSGPFGVQQSGPFGGQQSGPFGGQPAPKAPQDDLEPDNNIIDFKPTPVATEKCLTEACAVASYMSTKTDQVGDVGEGMTLCFDVGGSTTDISALLPTGDSNGMGSSITLIKQNSIRFAAQRVSNAASIDPNLKSVLQEVCRQSNPEIIIPGLTVGAGPDKYNASTAPYFFDQVLDRLKTEDLPRLYTAIKARCPKLMAVNLYVTGLIMYYAGQLTNKLVKVVRKSLGGKFEKFTPVVSIKFAGKGARIFEWLSTTNYEDALNYYRQMFLQGVDQEEYQSLLGNQWPNIDLAQQVSDDVKYEVSKGLAFNGSQSINVPSTESEAIEILGEDNFYFIKSSDGSTVPLSFDNAITPKMMSRLGNSFCQTRNNGSGFQCSRFVNFAGVFYNAATSNNLKLDQNAFVQAFNNMNISTYIRQQPEYRNAQNVYKATEGKSFPYVAPIIILEGMKFYDDYLLTKIL